MATPTSNSTNVTYRLPISYNNEIDSLLLGMKWGGGLGTGVTLSYSFPSGTTYFDPNYGSNYDSSEVDAGWYVLNTTQQLAFESALSTISDVANITFVESEDTASTVGEIRVAMSEEVAAHENRSAWAYSPASHPSAGDIWLNPDRFLSDPISAGTWKFNTLIHELGHAVGLSHTFDSESGSGASLPGGVNGTDNIFYTVMSYTKDTTGNDYRIDREPDTLMLLDIQALQYLYGANTSHNSGDTTYTFNGNGKYFETIWDGGGEDAIDYTESTTGATIDLREGAWSSLGKPVVFTNNYGVQQYTDPRTVWIAYGAEIENAYGSQKDDVIYGNDLNNELYGHWGADSLSGYGGDDWLIFSLDEAATSASHAGSPGVTGSGERLQLTGKWQSLDIYDGGEGYDTLWSGSYDDVVFLDNGTGSPLLVSVEAIKTRGGDDFVDLTSNSFVYGDVSIFGGDGNDIIWSNAGNDHLYGEAGDDTIDGGVGVDFIVGGAGVDTLLGGLGNDWLEGGAGNDYLDGGEGYDTAVINFLPSQYELKNGILSGPEGSDTLVDIERIFFDVYIGDSKFWTYIDPNEFIDPDGLGGDAVSGVTESLNDITDLYVAYFNRAPDPNGLKYWFVEINDATLSLIDTAKSFTDQQEYRDTYPDGLGNREFVQLIYQNLFDREPDQAGWDYWEADLNNGLPRDTFILTIINGAYDGPSAEDKALLNNKHDASMYYSEQLTLNPSEGFDANISEVLNNVSANIDTLASAIDVIDYAMDDPITLSGIVADQDLWDSLWA